MQWKRATFKIALNPRAPQSANDDGVRQGLALGPLAAHKGTGTSYQITHIPSGFRVADSIPRLADAKTIAVAISPLADWSQMDPLRSLNEEQRAQIRRACCKELR